ncbi:hypothetical protein ASD64_10500 [Mesorhizobium sp. Root157]|uniref:DUF4424 domain-containing protein n=1 Tax=Mesorhizobium sp. Root157 TaxID=1736477 RepID=UPI0006FA5BCC|nr:DUF4424 domain-containing protein [Mesorhizobium sp. Root157]KQZ81459.1 hypothetical protein ASD64_10500 [Mesorhizobium sp. Root157]
MFRTALTASLALATWPALANDSTAELGTGGLILSRNDVIAMQSEDLFISREQVKVDYVFRNGSDADITTIVAFPMPKIAGGPDLNVALPGDASDNFLGFSVVSDGQAIEPQLEQKVFAVGLDITEQLKAHGISLNPFAQEVYGELEKLPDAIADDWRDRGFITLNEYDDGTGWKKERTPLWELRSTYWWRATFPAGKDVHVSHTYKPSVGGTAGLSFFYDGKFQGDYDDYKSRYCLDSGFENAVRRGAKANGDGFPPYSESRIDYVLTTGGNWALGSIGTFRLTIDKGDAKSIVSFCGTGVKKVGPTTFQMEAKDFYPERDIEILFLDTWSDEGGPQ